MKTACRILILALALAALLFVPDGKILPEVQNDYFIGETPAAALALRPYGAVLAGGALLALLLLRGLGKVRSLSFLSGAALLGFLCSRLVYCLVNIDFYTGPASLAAVLRWWEGGMSMTGALGGIALAAFLFLRKEPRSLEALALTLPPMICVFRLGETFTSIGRGMDVEFGGIFTIPDMFGNVLNVWLLEALSALLIWGLLLLWRRKDTLCPRGGRLLAAFFVLWGVVQILMESLRYDQHMIWSFVKAQMLFSFLGAAGCLFFVGRPVRRGPAALVASVLLAAGVFGLEKALDRLAIPDYLLYLAFLLLIGLYLFFAFTVFRRREKSLAPAPAEAE